MRRSRVRSWAEPGRAKSPSVAAVARISAREMRPERIPSSWTSLTSSPSTSRATSPSRRLSPASTPAATTAAGASVTGGMRRARTVAVEPSGSENSAMLGNTRARLVTAGPRTMTS